MQRTLKALEFDKVLEHFSSFCVSNSARQKALELKPHLSPYGVEYGTLYHNRDLFCQTRDWLLSSRFEFCAFPELDGILNYLKTSHAFLDAEALWAVKQTLSALLCVRESIEKCAHTSPVLAEFTLSTQFPTEFYDALSHCIGDSATLRDNASPKLLLIRNELRGHNQNCLRKVKEAIAEFNMAHYLQDDFISLNSDRYVLPLKANFKGRMQGIIHHYSNTGETVYFEPLFLVEINNRIQELKQEEREEENKILLNLTTLMLDNISCVSDSWQLFLDIDILQAKVLLARQFDGLCLIMNEEDTSIFNLPHAKHPLLAVEEAKNPNFNLKPLDIHLREAERVLVISGGNAGGKTVCLKTAGLIVVMTLAGLPVPVAANASLPCITKVHAFIGDEQSLDEHVSTFTGQIKHLANAWDELDENSLILLDEFGAGTDPTQGVALAQAVIDGILEKKAFAFSATHFPALKTYALTHEHVRAASVLFNDKTKKAMYTLAYDQVGASSALDVAREHGLASSIIEKAEKYLLLDGQDSTKAVDILNSLAVEREEEIAILRKEQAKASQKTKDLQAKFEAEKQKLHEEVRAKSLELMHAWKEGKNTAKQSMKEMAKMRANLAKPLATSTNEQNKQSAQNSLDLEKLKADDSINYLPWDKQALVKEVDIKNKKIKIDLNGVSLWVTHEDVGVYTHAKKDDKSSIKSLKKSNDKSNTSTTLSPKGLEEMTRQRLDIRGKRADFALIELESFLDKALLNSIDIVEIVHGKGTGALRKSVHDFLRSSLMVSHYEKANEDQGGDGMTLAYVK